jgi:hypothetical protein
LPIRGRARVVGHADHGGEEAGNGVQIEVSLDIALRSLQKVLYRLATGTRYVFLESLTIRTTGGAAGLGGAGEAPLRVDLGLRALWQLRAT